MSGSVPAGDIPEFFFDRNWHSFNSILDIYRTGVLHLNTDLCALVLQKDLEYWQIDELILGKINIFVWIRLWITKYSTVMLNENGPFAHLWGKCK